MELSRRQDLAGARIVVRDLAGQDIVTEKIRHFYTEQGSGCRLIDRRKDPRFGYKAVHLVVRIDEMPVEIQIRTELQDTWAQIVERLADRWGRSIRYGQDPENPEWVVRSGELVMSRREALRVLMTLSDAIAAAEQTRRLVEEDQQMLKDTRSRLEQARGVVKTLSERAQSSRIPEETAQILPQVARILAAYSEELDAEGQGLLAAGADITLTQFTRIIEIGYDFASRETSERAAQLVRDEQQLRDILELVAGATDEGA